MAALALNPSIKGEQQLKTRGMLLFVFLLAACGSEELDDDCSHQMDDTRRSFGEPLRIEDAKRDEGRGERWYYANFTRTFVWIERVPGSCEVREN